MKPIIAACCLIALVALAGPAAAADVSQGKCIQYDKQSAIITLEEFDTQFSAQDPYGRPTGVKSAFDVSGAEIGILPEPGDILRLAYRVEGDRKVALRVMNVSKQDLRKK